VCLQLIPLILWVIVIVMGRKGGGGLRSVGGGTLPDSRAMDCAI
jgi:hypothetical protein